VKIEHIAFNIPDPRAAADWYVANLGMRIVRAGAEPKHGRFVADDAGVMFELYNDAAAPHTGLAGIDVAALHVALASADIEDDVARLVAAGAAQIGGINTTPAGDRLAFLRDPFGLTLQLAQRVKPIV